MIGAQSTSDPIRSEIVSLDASGSAQVIPDGAMSPSISETGGVVVYETVTSDPPDLTPFAGRRVWIRDRVGGTSRAVAETDSAAPAISGNGCLVGYTVVVSDRAELTVVDRCANSIDFPLPIGTVVDTVSFDAASAGAGQVAAPALSFDGSTIVWSTGREIRRYVRPAAGGPHALSQTFDVVAGGVPEMMTGSHTDVSADGQTVVFLAGPGSSPFEPSPANVYVWTSTTPQLDPELISTTTTGEAAPSSSASPTITADGSFVVFESSAVELAVAGPTSVVPPFVVGVDRVARTGQILVEDASRPAVSSDGNHVVYQRRGAVRVLSSDATSTVDEDIEELSAAQPTGAVAISQFGRWLVFASTTDLADLADPADLADASAPASPSPEAAAVWAIDRASSNPDVVDTTTSTTQPPTSTTVAPATTSPTEATPTVPDSGSEPATTVPATTSPSTVIVPRFPTVGTPFPTVGFPPVPRRSSTSTFSRSNSSFDPDPAADLTAFAVPVTFEPTVIDAGRRTASVVFTNPTSDPVEVTSAVIEPPAVFEIVSDSCSGTSVVAGGTCLVEVRFAPTAVGPTSAVLTFEVAGSSPVTALLDGEGVPEPTMDLVPPVAGAGQTVTVFGVGFPPGSIIELLQPGSSTTESITVDVDGTFAHVVVVLPNTPTGPITLSVAGQLDWFADVDGELLVSSRGAASADAALRGSPVGALVR